MVLDNAALHSYWRCRNLIADKGPHYAVHSPRLAREEIPKRISHIIVQGSFEVMVVHQDVIMEGNVRSLFPVGLDNGLFGYPICHSLLT